MRREGKRKGSEEKESEEEGKGMERTTFFVAYKDFADYWISYKRTAIWN